MKNIAFKKALIQLQQSGYEAYLVGGATRDYVMHRVPHDFDICTNALPNQIKEVFKEYHYFCLGEKHGTITVIIDKTPLEITTYRKEDEYEDFRRPSNVIFTLDVKEDIIRRDFTINAILMDNNYKIYDYVNGIEDINHGLIRAIGNPHKRFKEDALRIFRALRLSAELNFKLEEETLRAMQLNAHLIKHISNERKSYELLRIIKANPFILNEYKDIINHYISFSDIPLYITQTNNLNIRLAVIFKDYQDELNKLTLSKQDRKIITELINYQDISDNPIEALSNIDDMSLFIEFQLLTKQIDYQSFIDNNIAYIVNLTSLDISSKELIELGFTGKKISEIKKELIQKIQRKELTNTRKDILKYLK